LELTANRTKPRAARKVANSLKSFLKFFKLVAKALKTVLHCKASLIAAQRDKTTFNVGLLH
jgi:hypothetical protein